MNISDINGIELKYNGNIFEFLFLLDQNVLKALLINKMNSVFACELYCILDNKLNLKEKEVHRSVTFQRPIVKRFKNAIKTNIDNRKRLIERNNSNTEHEITIENNNSFYCVEDDNEINQ